MQRNKQTNAQTNLVKPYTVSYLRTRATCQVCHVTLIDAVASNTTDAIGNLWRIFDFDASAA